MVDGVPRRACDKCRADYRRVYTCQGCKADQGGRRYQRGGLTLCLECEGLLAQRLEDDAAGHLDDGP